MGGASRNEKRRRQEAAEQRLRAAGITPPKKKTGNTALAVVGVVVALAVGTGLMFLTTGSGPVTPTYRATVSGAVITAGDGPTVIDVYEDYLCPNCERFEERYGDDLTTALNEGEVTVRYHAVAILDGATTPPGYSTRAANAAVCSVPAGVFPAYHARLFEEQPAEGGPGLTDEQLIAFGTEAGATGDFAGCVRGAPHAAAVAAETAASAADPTLLTDGAFGTPTVAVNGARIDINAGDWLRDAVAAP